LPVVLADLDVNASHTSADIQIVYQSVPHEAWLVLLGVYFILGAIAVALVAHLFGFHVYLSEWIPTILEFSKTNM